MKNEELKNLLTLFLSKDSASETLAIQMIYALELSDANKLLDMMKLKEHIDIKNLLSLKSRELGEKKEALFNHM